jgi:hypothetical protein
VGFLFLDILVNVLEADKKRRQKMKKLLIITMVAAVCCVFMAAGAWALSEGLYEWNETGGSGQGTFELTGSGSSIDVTDSWDPTNYLNGTYSFDGYGYVLGAFDSYINHSGVDDSWSNWTTESIIRWWCSSLGNVYGTLTETGPEDPRPERPEKPEQSKSPNERPDRPEFPEQSNRINAPGQNKEPGEPADPKGTEGVEAATA